MKSKRNDAENELDIEVETELADLSSALEKTDGLVLNVLHSHVVTELQISRLLESLGYIE